jgi:hypothetical protein
MKIFVFYKIDNNVYFKFWFCLQNKIFTFGGEIFSFKYLLIEFTILNLSLIFVSEILKTHNLHPVFVYKIPF